MLLSPSKPKLVIFAGLCGYFLLSFMLVFPIVPEFVLQIIGPMFLPAVGMMIAVAHLFGVGYREVLDGKGPGPSAFSVTVSWVSAMVFGLFLLYLFACLLGAWYESVQRRVNK